MNKEDLEQLALTFPENEDLINVYEEWGGSEYLHELFEVLGRYEPDWNKEKELGSWAAEFILDILQDVEEELPEMSREQRIEKFDGLLDERYEDFRCGHQFARINNINLTLQEGEDLDAVLAESDEKIQFPILK